MCASQRDSWRSSPSSGYRGSAIVGTPNIEPSSKASTEVAQPSSRPYWYQYDEGPWYQSVETSSARLLPYRWTQSSRAPRPRASRHLRQQQPEPLRVGDLALRTLSKQLDNLWVQVHLLQRTLLWQDLDPGKTIEAMHSVWSQRQSKEPASTSSGQPKATGE